MRVGGGFGQGQTVCHELPHIWEMVRPLHEGGTLEDGYGPEAERGPVVLDGPCGL